MVSGNTGPRTEARLFRARVHPTSADAFRGHITVKGEVVPVEFDVLDNPISAAAWDLLDNRSADRLSVLIEIQRKDGNRSKHSAVVSRGNETTRQTFLEFTDGSRDSLSVGSAMPKLMSLRRHLTREEARALHTQQADLEERLWKAFEHVALDPAHRDVYSTGFARILRDAGSLFASALAIAVKTKSGILKPTIDDYRRYLVDEVEAIERRSVDIRELHRASLLLPLEDTSPTTSPSWWQPFTDVKHDAIANIQAATLRHALHAVAATRLLDFWASGNSQGVFVNVGIAYPPGSTDLSNRRFFGI